MNVPFKALVQRLVETPGPSGYETQVRKVIGAEIEAFADEVYTDNLGNLIARKGQAGDQGLKIMLAAHMDEIGLIASHIDDNGFVRFLPIGAVFARTCIGGRVRFMNGTTGVIGAERLADLKRVPALEQMYIDLGVSRREEAPIQVGDVATFERPFVDMGKRLVSKALDDRIGVAVLIETLRQLEQTSNQVYFVFSVQEEVGVRGATTAAYSLEPDLGLAVDVTSSGDTPKGIIMELGLGKGPAIKVRDAGMLSDPRVVKWIVSAAEQAGLPYQLEVLLQGGTDARAIQLSRAGVPAGSLSIPCRYVHSPSEMVDCDDVQNAVLLLLELLRKPVELGEL